MASAKCPRQHDADRGDQTDRECPFPGGMEFVREATASNPSRERNIVAEQQQILDVHQRTPCCVTVGHATAACPNRTGRGFLLAETFVSQTGNARRGIQNLSRRAKIVPSRPRQPTSRRSRRSSPIRSVPSCRQSPSLAARSATGHLLELLGIPSTMPAATRARFFMGCSFKVINRGQD